MYIYKTEMLGASFKLFSDKADENDLLRLDRLINDRYAEGWELVTYDYMATSTQLKGAFIITFRKEQA